MSWMLLRKPVVCELGSMRDAKGQGWMRWQENRSYHEQGEKINLKQGAAKRNGKRNGCFQSLPQEAKESRLINLLQTLQSRLCDGHSVYNMFMADKIVTHDSFCLSELWSHRLRTTQRYLIILCLTTRFWSTSPGHWELEEMVQMHYPPHPHPHNTPSNLCIRKVCWGKEFHGSF